MIHCINECGYNVTHIGIFSNIVQNYRVLKYDQNFLKSFNWKWYILCYCYSTSLEMCQEWYIAILCACVLVCLFDLVELLDV